MKVSPRFQVVKEFLQTEKNYVGILHTLLNVSIFYFFMGRKFMFCAFSGNVISSGILETV